MHLDSTDQAIIARLGEDGRATYSDIAKEIGVSVSTVRNRVTALRESGALLINTWLDPYRVGLGVTATLMLRVEGGKLDAVTKVLIDLPSTGYIAAVAGDHDLTVDVFCRDVPHLHDVLHNEVQTIDGVVHVTSYLVTEIKFQSSVNLAQLMDQANGAADT